MPASQLYKPVDIQPLTGTMDARSTPDQVPFGAWRYLQNLEVREQNGLYRASGWEKLLSQGNYNNQDLHDQLLSVAGGGAVKEPVTFLFEAVSTGGFSRLIAGTPRRLYALQNATGNWKILSDQLGSTLAGTCDDYGWSAGQIGDHVVLSNGVDPIIYWVFDQHVNQDSDQSVKTIPDLELIGVSSAKVVMALNGVIVLMNVVQEGFRYPMRVIVSDVNRPLSFRPNQGQSVASVADLSGVGEYIISAAPLGNVIMIYTNLGIWEMTLSGDVDTFVEFRRRYHAPNTNRCLAYKRTLVSTGVDHYYMGRDGIYQYSPYTPEPVRTPWIHRASSVIFNDINAGLCNAHVAAYNPSKKTILFSWAQSGNDCPSKTLAVNTEYEHCGVVDHGFTAFSNYSPDNPTTVRDWILDNCICTPQGLIDAGFGSIKEGGYCVAPEDPVCDTYPVNIYSDQSLDVGDGVMVEDYTQEEPSPGSLCDILGNLTAQELCDLEFGRGECRAEQLFIGVSATDQCIKTFAEVYYRERCIQFSPCGAYVFDPYETLFRSGALDFRAPQQAKTLGGMVVLEAFAAMSTDPVDIFLRVGAAHQAADSNLDRCAIRWSAKQARLLKCASPLTAEELIAKGLRPSVGIEWPIYTENNFLFFEFSINDVGGASRFSRVGLMLRGKATRY